MHGKTTIKKKKKWEYVNKLRDIIPSFTGKKLEVYQVTVSD
jgi:hypothetical protein